MSPYLFILCANIMLSQEVKLQNIHGLKVARGAPIISHMFFADDNFLFTIANLKEEDMIMNTLQK